MNLPGHKFIAAITLAAIYTVLAIGFICADRKPPQGGLINIQGMMSYLTTLPVAAPLELCGRKINFRSNWQMGSAIAVCASLLFAITFGALSLIQYIWVALHGSR